MLELLDSGETGVRAAFYGHDWPSTREALAPALDVLIDEFNAELNSME